MMWPRYWTTSRPPTRSIDDAGISSSRVTISSGIAARRSPASSTTSTGSTTSVSSRRVDRREPPTGVGEHVRPPGQGRGVEDEHDGAVTEDRRAGVDRDALELPAERLDDDLLGVEHVVDDEPEPLLLGVQDDDEAAALVGDPVESSVVGPRHEPELLVEPDERQQHVAQPVDRGAGDELDAAAGVLAVTAAPARAR